MTFNLNRLIVAVLIAVIVGIALVAFLGPILVSLKVPVATTVGHGLIDYGYIIGVIAGLWYYFTGGTL